jgi:beta-glucanase (GH16 family)
MAVAMLLFTSACGGSSGGGTTTQTVTIAMTPTLSVIDASTTLQYTATVSGATNTGVTWSITEGSTGGSVSSTGLYTAPTTSGTYHIVATSVADTTQTVTATVYVDAAVSSWALSWNDEFTGTSDTAPDSTKWVHDTGGYGWGNSELECYTDSTDNSYQDGNGNLVISALSSPSHTCSDGNVNNYTSARLKTQTLFTQTYGRFEARIKLPYGAGIWPAFWMLGSNITTVSWPSCGEVDILENVPSLGESTIQSTIHMPSPTSSSTNISLGTKNTLASGETNDGEYHIYGVIWSPGKVSFYVDDYTKPFVTYTAVDAANAGGKWVFNTPFFLILNTAVGGSWPGSPDSTTVWPQNMYVDYVRVYTAE